MPRLEPWEHTTRRLIPHRSARILPPPPVPSSPSLSAASVYVGPACLPLALSHPGAPFSPLLGGWFFRLAPPSVPSRPPLSLSLSALVCTPRAARRSCLACIRILHTCLPLVHVRSHICTRAHTLMQHPLFIPSLVLSYSLAPPVFFFFVPPRSVTPACNGRPRRILLISWHATLSPCSAFISLRRLYPPLRYSLSLLPFLSSPLFGYLPSPSSRVRGAANLFFLRLARGEVSSPPSFPLHLFFVFLSYTSRASARLSVLRCRPLSSFFTRPPFSLVPCCSPRESPPRAPGFGRPSSARFARDCLPSVAAR